MVPHLIGPPIGNHAPPTPLVPPCHSPLPPTHCSHWFLILLVPSVILVTQLSLVPHLIGPPMEPFLPCSHWSPISLVPQWNPAYTVLVGPPSHWSPSLTPSTLFSLVPHLIGPPMRPWLHSSHCSPISLVPQCDPDYTVLIVPPSHWSPNATLITQFSLVPHLIGPPV